MIATLADVAPAFNKTKVCAIICPVIGGDCQKDHCNENAENSETDGIQPRNSKSNDYGDYGDYADTSR